MPQKIDMCHDQSSAAVKSAGHAQGQEHGTSLEASRIDRPPHCTCVWSTARASNTMRHGQPNPGLPLAAIARKPNKPLCTIVYYPDKQFAWQTNPKSCNALSVQERPINASAHLSTRFVGPECDLTSSTEQYSTVHYTKTEPS